MKGILASLVLASLLLLPTVAPQDEPPSPISANAIVTPSGATVRWVPPALTPEQVEAAAFRVYGYAAGHEPKLLETTDGLTVYAEVAAGYDSYAVALVLDGVESLHVEVFVCVSIELNPPGVQNDC